MTIVLFALAMAAMLVMVALVIDMSDLRNTRQSNKLIADVAAAAGAQSLAPDNDPKPWRGVCKALTYLKANQRSKTFVVTYLDGSGNAVGGNPCTDRLAQVCVASTPTTWAWIRATSGALVADIRSGYTTPDAAFPEDATAYASDNGVALLGGCDQLAVIVANQDAALFGGIARQTSYASKSRSVARVALGTANEGVPAFIMLERKRCDVLSQFVGTGGGSGISVEPASSTQPGVIHLDSSGTDSSCTGGGGSGSYTLYSSTIGSSAGVIAKPAGLTPGVISLRALAMSSPNAWSSASGVSPTPTPGLLVSRKVVDDKYNPGSPYTATISALHAASYIDATRTVAPTGGWTRVAACSNQFGTMTGAKIFVDCPGGYSPGGVTFSGATEVIFNGPVQIKNGAFLYMPAATRVVVGGDSTGGLSVSNGGRLGINSVTPFADTAAGVSSACSGREGPAWTQTAKLTVFGGASSGGTAGGLNVGGRVALCQTSVYLAGPKVASNATYVRQAITDGSDDATCTSAKPCPKMSSNVATNASFSVSGYLQWSAPNQSTTQPAPGAVGLEDLALWTETAALCDVKSGGILASAGVFFLPNARTEMRSPSTATPVNAQFIGQSMSLLQGTMVMQPTPSDAVQVPVLLSVGMVR